MVLCAYNHAQKGRAYGVRFFFVRHGQTDWNREERWQGREDIPLNACGVAQAAQCARELRALGIPFAYLASSTLSRALQTAAIIARSLGIDEVVEDERLMERDLGAASGLLRSVINERYPTRDIPGYESEASLEERLGQFLAFHAQNAPGREIIAVTHGGVMGKLKRMAGGAYAQSAPLANGGILTLDYDGGILRLGNVKKI